MITNQVTLFKHYERQKWHIQDGKWSLCGMIDYYLDDVAGTWKVEDIAAVNQDVICKNCIRIRTAILEKQRG